jgi:hypothetical protein
LNHAAHSLIHDPPWAERLIAQKNADALGLSYDEYIAMTNPSTNVTWLDLLDALAWSIDILDGGPSGEGILLSAFFRGGSKIIQYGGKTITEQTLKKLGLTVNHRDAVHRAVSRIRQDHGLSNSFHGNIAKNGNYIDPSTNKILGNIFDFID